MKRALLCLIALTCAGDHALGEQAGRAWPDYIQRRVAARGAAGLSAQASSQASTGRYQCAQACTPSPTTIYCLTAPRNPQLGAAFRTLGQRFADPAANRITAVDLRRYFSVSDDLCQRSDTSKSNGVWTNSGLPCDLGARLTVGTASVGMVVHVPPDFIFTSGQASPGLLTLTPRTTVTLLQFDDPDIEDGWGGVVQAVSGAADSALFQMPRGCIKVPFQ